MVSDQFCLYLTHISTEGVYFSQHIHLQINNSLFSFIPLPQTNICVNGLIDTDPFKLTKSQFLRLLTVNGCF